jgi:ABC-type transporter Mla subunit MlaD
LDVDRNDNGRQPLGYFDDNAEHMIPGPGMRAPASVPPDQIETEVRAMWTEPEGGEVRSMWSELDQEAGQPKAEVESPSTPAEDDRPPAEVRPLRPSVAEAPPAAAAPPSRTPDAPSFLTDELRPILVAAEQAAAQIVERAKRDSDRDRAELDKLRRRVEAQIADLNSWRDRSEPTLRSLQQKVADIQSKIQEVPELIRQALDPVAGAISSLDPTLAELTTVSTPLLYMERIHTEGESTERTSWEG